MKKIFSILCVSLGLTGCAELSSINDAVGDMAGKLNSVLGAGNGESSSGGLTALSMPSQTHAYVLEDSVKAKKDIDTLYIRLKREFKFETKDEALGSSWGRQRDWLKTSLEQRGLVHEATPGVYYHMADAYSSDSFIDMTLEKEGNNVHISWKTKSNDKDFGAWVKAKVAKAIK